MLIDNSGAIDLCERVGVSKRTEHFQRWQHYCRYMARHHIITKLHFVRTHEQLADQLTKMGDKTSFLRTRNVMLNLGKADDTIESKASGRICEFCIMRFVNIMYCFMKQYINYTFSMNFDTKLILCTMTFACKLRGWILATLG